MICFTQIYSALKLKAIFHRRTRVIGKSRTFTRGLCTKPKRVNNKKKDKTTETKKNSAKEKIQKDEKKQKKRNKKK